MRFLVDESVDRPIAHALREQGYQVACIVDTRPGLDDDAVLSAANAQGAILLTADKDFGELVFREARATAGVLLIRLAPLSLRRRSELVAAAVREHGEDLRGRFCVIAPGHIRMRRKP